MVPLLMRWSVDETEIVPASSIVFEGKQANVRDVEAFDASLRFPGVERPRCLNTKGIEGFLAQFAGRRDLNQRLGDKGIFRGVAQLG